MPCLKIRIDGEVKKVNYSVRKDGRWYVRINLGVKNYKEDGTPVYDYKSIYAHGEAELRQKLKDFYDDIEERKKSNEIFASDILSWLKLSYWKHVRATTYDRHEQVVIHQIIPEANKLSHKKVSQITMDDCKTMLGNIRLAYSESTYKKARYLLKSYFRDQLISGKIDRDPTDYVIHSKMDEKFEDDSDFDEEDDDGISDEDTDLVYLEDSEIEKIKDVIYNGYELTGKTRALKNADGTEEQHEYTYHKKVTQGLFFIFMLNTGLRAGEAVALKYSDIDFENGTMTVRKNVKYAKKRDENGNATGSRVKKIGKPKTKKSNATVKINAKAISILKEMLKNEPEGYTGYIVHDIRKSSDDFEPYRQISPHALYKRWQAVCKYAGVTPKGLHCLRHTCASKMFEATNGNAKAVSVLLRHKDVAFTMKVYVSLMKKYEQEIAEEFEV